MADVDGCGEAAEVLGCGSISSAARFAARDVDGTAGDSGAVGVALPALRRIFRGGLIILYRMSAHRFIMNKK